MIVDVLIMLKIHKTSVCVFAFYSVYFKGHNHRFSRFLKFFIMHINSISDQKTKMSVSYDRLKERYKPQMFCYINTGDSLISPGVYNAAYIHYHTCHLNLFLESVNINRARALLTLGDIQSAISCA